MLLGPAQEVQGIKGLQEPKQQVEIRTCMELRQSSDGFRLRRDSQFRGEVTKAHISMIIAMVFICCHSVKWITNVFEITLVSN